MVAYAYAAQYPAEVERIALMDAFLPGVGDWTKVWLLRDLWHFHFYGETPLSWSRAASGSISSISGTISPPTAKHSVSEADRRFYAKAYAQPGGMRGRLRGVPRLRAGRQGLRGASPRPS